MLLSDLDLKTFQEFAEQTSQFSPNNAMLFVPFYLTLPHCNHTLSALSSWVVMCLTHGCLNGLYLGSEKSYHIKYSFISCSVTHMDFVFTCCPPNGLYAVTTCPMNMEVGTMTAPHAIGAVTSLVTSCCPAGNLERVKWRKGKKK